jgi:hypothetical protein
MTTASRNLVHQIIADFAPRHVRKPRVFIPGRKSDRRALTSLGVAPLANVTMPDMVIHDLERDWLFLIDASPRYRHLTESRRSKLSNHFASSGRHIELFSAFRDHREFSRCIESIAWETNVWVASSPDHMIHFNGERFLGPYR